MRVRAVLQALILLAIAATAPQGTPRAVADDGYARLEGHGGPIKGVAVSVDGARALTASFDYTVGLWDLGTAKLIRFLDGHRAAANAVAFLPDGHRALSAGDDFDLILWDLDTGAVLRRMQGHKGKVISVAVSPDGTLAASAGWDGVVGLWPLDHDGPPRWLKGHRNNVNDAVFSPDGKRLFTASYDGTIREWDLASGHEERVLVEHGFGVNTLVLNEPAGWIAYGAVDGAVRALDLATGRQLADLTADRRPILAMAANPDRTAIAVGDGEGYVMVIDTTDWTIRRDFHAAVQGPIWALAWDPAGDRLLAGGIADEAALWPVSGDGDALFAEARKFHTPPSEMSNGERQFVRKCSICHTLAPPETPGQRHRAGPSLHGLFGRKAGTLPGYSYSPALTGSSVVWNAETIDKLFELGPDHFTPGSKMPMQRIAKPEDRLDLIAYLRENAGPAEGQKP